VHAVQGEFGLPRLGVPQQLRALRDRGFATVRAVGNGRLERQSWPERQSWLELHRRFWTRRLDALDRELTQGKPERRVTEGTAPSSDGTPERSTEKDREDS